MKLYWMKGSAISLLIVIATALILYAQGSTAQDKKPSTTFELRPGLVVDLNQRRAYMMKPAGGIEAIDLKSGTPVWMSREAAKPLALSGHHLLAQTEMTGQKNKFEILVLDVSKRGERVRSHTVTLPAGVEVAVDDTLHNSFLTTTRPEDNIVVVFWENKKRIVKGMAPLAEEVHTGRAARDEAVTRGSLQIDRASGAVSQGPSPSSLPSRNPIVPASMRLRSAPSPQFLSGDGLYIMNSRRIEGDNVWEKYQWSIYEAASGKQVGSFRRHLSWAPFFISGSQVVYETGPYERRTNKGLTAEPLKLRGVDLIGGKELWSVEIRDTAYRGPIPP